MANDSGKESGVIKSVSREGRQFPPPADFTARALINDAGAYERLYRRSIDDPEGFWAETARAELSWSKPFTKVLDWQAAVFASGSRTASSTCRRTAWTATWPRAATRSRSTGKASRATAAR